MPEIAVGFADPRQTNEGGACRHGKNDI